MGSNRQLRGLRRIPNLADKRYPSPLSRYLLELIPPAARLQAEHGHPADLDRAVGAEPEVPLELGPNGRRLGERQARTPYGC
jgi:hypothetical protein